MLTKPYKSTAPVPLMKLPPSPGSLYVLRNVNSTVTGGSRFANTQGYCDSSISVLRFELCEIGSMLRGLIEFVVYPGILDFPGAHI